MTSHHGTATTPTTPDRKFANTLARGLSVLRAFRVSDDGLSHGQIVARTGLSPATVTRLTYTLRRLGYLSQNGSLLRLGPAALALASVANAQAAFVDLADGAMQELASRTGTLVLMAVHDGTSMALLRTWRPRGTASIWLEPGNRVPMAGSSTGQAFLAALDEVGFQALRPDAAQQAQRAAGRAQLADLGFIFVAAPDRYSEGVMAVARPFHARDMASPVVFACGAMPAQLSEDRIRTEVGPALRDVVRDLEFKSGSRRGAEGRR